MLEETLYGTPIGPRQKACLRQCRLARFHSGESITNGNCPCQKPTECRFFLADYRKGDEAGLIFPDLKEFYNQLWTE